MKNIFKNIFLILRFLIRVKLLGLPFLYKKERLNVYKNALSMLISVESYSDGSYAECHSLCSIFEAIYEFRYSKDYLMFVEPTKIKTNFPEIYKNRPLNKFTDEQGYETKYWFNLDKDGMYQRQRIVQKAINKMK